MNENRSIVEEVKNNICDECRVCSVYATNENGEKFRVDASYCDDGSAYITLDLYNAKDEWIDSCKLKDWTDSCNFPFNLIPNPEPDCNCI